MLRLRLLVLALLGAAAALGVTLLLQRQEAGMLRSELALRRESRAALARLRAENAQLAQQLPAAAQLAAMRADHAAVLRLRAEVEAVRDDVQQRERM